MKRKPRLTKKERKALAGGPRPAQVPGPKGHQHQHQHIHCVACGRHIDASEFDEPATATVISCEHGSQFPSCVACTDKTNALLEEHDRTGKPVEQAQAWH